jgi:hypothetical protein
MNFLEFKGDGADWVTLARDRDRLRALVVRGNKPSDSIKYGEFLE